MRISDWSSDVCSSDLKSRESRSKNRHQLNARIAAWTERRPSAEWIDLMTEAGVPCGPIYTIDRTMADPQVAHLGMARPVAHPVLGEIRLVAPPNNISGFSKDIRPPTPELGQPTEPELGRAQGRERGSHKV